VGVPAPGPASRRTVRRTAPNRRALGAPVAAPASVTSPPAEPAARRASAVSGWAVRRVATRSLPGVWCRRSHRFPRRSADLGPTPQVRCRFWRRTRDHPAMTSGERRHPKAVVYVLGVTSTRPIRRPTLPADCSTPRSRWRPGTSARRARPRPAPWYRSTSRCRPGRRHST